MTNLWSKYLLPAALAGLVLAETAGSGTLYRRESPDLLRRIDIAALQVDTLQRDSTAAAAEARPEKGKKGRSRKKKDDKKERPAPPPRPKVEDVFIWDDDTVFFGPGRKVDTLPSITARDTMKVPDSLRSVNPFLYKWYVATKDSLIHRVVVDSLKAAGDSLDWPVIDSLYLADSAAVAKAAFDRWYASLSKAERKRYDYEQLLPMTGMAPDEWWVNMSRVNGIDATDPEQYTRGEEICIRQNEEIARYLKAYIPGFENAYVDRVAPFMGIRETRRIIGEYVLTEQDIFDCARFDDAIGVAAYPVDLHHPVGGDCTLMWCPDCYDIPYRCLVPQQVDGLLCAGRCISATHLALASVRVMGPAMCIGEAAGKAASIAAETGLPPRAIDVARLRTELRAEGAFLR